jgi:hypothetical protein
MLSVIFRADGSACLYPAGAAERYRKTTRMIEALGGTIIRNRLSRVDICLDMPGVDTCRMLHLAWSLSWAEIS